MGVRVLCLALFANVVLGQDLNDKIIELQNQLNALQMQQIEAQTPESAGLQMVGGNLNVRLPRNAEMTVQKTTTLSVTGMDTRLSDVEEKVSDFATIAELENIRAAAQGNAFEGAQNATSGIYSQMQSMTVKMQEFKKKMNDQFDEYEKAIKGKISNSKIQIADKTNKYATDAAKAFNDFNKSVSQSVTQFNSETGKTLDGKIDKVNKDLSSKLDAQKKDVDKKMTDFGTNFIVGWKECSQWGTSGADHNTLRMFHYCDYVKKRDDTVLYISINANIRQINGNSFWLLKVDNKECRNAQNSQAGDLEFRLHGSRSVDLHRPVMWKGVCWKANGQTIKKGKRRVGFYQRYVSADSYYGWESSQRMRVEEWVVEKDSGATTPNAPYQGWNP